MLAVTHFRDGKVLAEVSHGLGEAMVGLNGGKMESGRSWLGGVVEWVGCKFSDCRQHTYD